MKRKLSAAEKSDILEARRNGVSRVSLVAASGVSYKTIDTWERRAAHPSKAKKRGPRFALSKEQTDSLYSALEKDDALTNTQLVEQLNLPITPQSVSNYLHRTTPPFTTKKRHIDDTPSTRQMLECVDFVSKLRKIPLARRVYVDESYLYDNEQRSRGRSRQGQRITVLNKRKGKRLPFVVAVRQGQLVHPPLLVKKDFDDEHWREYALSVLLPRLRPDDIVIWDRLGRSGRKKNPNKQHYNPEVISRIEMNSRRRVVFLPPLGKLFNPVELVHSKLKQLVRSSFATSSAGQEGRARTFDELWLELVLASRHISSENIDAFFREHAQGRAFKNAHPHMFQ